MDKKIYKYNAKSLTKTQIKVINVQNELIKHHIESNFDFEPYAISRDKSGHIVVIDQVIFDKFNYKLSAKILGLNKEKNTLTLYTAGNLYLNQYYNDEGMRAIEFSHLTTHRAFEKLGIARILLQAGENFTLESGFDKIVLSQLIHYAPLSTPNMDVLNDANYLLDDYYFDKNYYLYYTQGFSFDKDVIVSDMCYPKSLRGLSKSGLKTRDVSTGKITNPLRKIDKNNRLFCVSEAYWEEQNYINDNMAQEDCVFEYYSNGDLKSEKFAPLILPPTLVSTKNLDNILHNVPTSSIKRKVIQYNIERLYPEFTDFNFDSSDEDILYSNSPLYTPSGFTSESWKQLEPILISIVKPENKEAIDTEPNV